MYAVFDENGIFLEGPSNLRSRFKDVQDFHLLSEEQRLALGWYPCTVQNESYDPLFEDRLYPTAVLDYVTSTAVVTYIIEEKTLEFVKREMLSRGKELTNSKLEALVNSIPQLEMLSWAKQEADAKSFISNGTSSAMLDTLAFIRNETVEVLCQKILGKSAQFATVSAQLIGEWHVFEKKVNSATTRVELEEVRGFIEGGE
jgi:hypothetical protein